MSIFEISSQNGCLFSRGAYFHGVLINACNLKKFPKFRLLFHVDSLLTIGNTHWQKVAATFKTAESANLLPFARNGCPFMWGAFFCMGAYKRDVVVVIKMGAYSHWMLILCECLLSRFYGIPKIL